MSDAGCVSRTSIHMQCYRCWTLVVRSVWFEPSLGKQIITFNTYLREIESEIEEFHSTPVLYLLCYSVLRMHNDLEVLKYYYLSRK